MRNQPSFQRFASVSAIVSFFLAVASIVFQGLPVKFSLEVFNHPMLLLSIGTNGARELRWGMIFDMLGYYLLLLPAAIFLQNWCEGRNPAWARFCTLCGVGYILVGAAGAAILAAALPSMITAYPQAEPAQRAVLETVFNAMWNLVYGGLWNLLEVLLAGLWLTGIGWLLRDERRIFSIASIVLGLAAFVDSAGMILSIDAAASLGLSVFLALGPVWALWLGLELLRKPITISTV